MTAAGKGDGVVRVIQNHIRHADEHVFLNVGIKLPVDFAQNVGSGRILARFAAQYASAHRHDQRGGNAFARDIRYDHAEPFVVYLNVIEIIATDLARGDIDAADFEAIDRRRLGWEQDALNIARNFEIVVEPLFLICLGVNDGVVERERRLFGD